MLRMMDDFELRALQQEQRDYERAKWFIASKQREQEKEIREERAEQNVGDLAASIVIADPIEVEAFRTDLDWTCPVLVPDTYLIYATNLSKARGLFPPSVECLRRGL